MCEYQRVEFTVRAVLLISVLIACATAPINMVVDFLFQDIISAPSADEYKVELQSRQLRQRIGRRMSAVAANARGAIRNSISIASNQIAPVLPVSRPTSLRMRWSSPHGSVTKQFTVPDVTTRRLPPSVTRSYASTSMILKDMFEHKVPPSESRRCVVAPVRRSVLLAAGDSRAEGEEEENESSLYDSVERGGMGDHGDTASFNSFYAMLCKQCENLNGDSKSEFQERWGFAPEYDALDNQSNVFGSDNEVVSGISAKIRSVLCSRNENKTRKHILSKAIEETSQFSKEKITKLKVASDMQVGLEIMHLFIIDLLG